MSGFAWRRDDETSRWIVGNWKMNGDETALAEFQAAFGGIDRFPGTRIGLAVSHTLIGWAARQLQGIAVGAQDVHQAESGAFTGSVSADMVQVAGGRFTIIGHSERRAAFSEDAAILRAKIDCAVRAGLSLLLCCGESEAIRAAGGALPHVIGQLAEVLSDDIDPLVLAVAYEPCWAIGAGAPPPIEELAAVPVAIRQWLESRFGASGAEVPILYGGAVDTEMAGTIRQKSCFDGVLIGRASLSAKAMASIVSQFGKHRTVS